MPAILHLPRPTLATAWCQEQRALGLTAGFVPTMGALHRGHAALISESAARDDVTCASIFVNPLQFNDPRDLERYPRTFERDLALLEEHGCDMVFTGTLQDFFPDAAGMEDIPLRDAGTASKGLEGDHRPGHLDGVATIVEQLFRTFGQGTAYFGAKDFQQSLVIKDLAAELGFPDIVVCPTVREPDGLALSSRNALLSTADRERATCLYRGLAAARAAWGEGTRNASALRTAMMTQIQGNVDSIDYADLRDPDDWQARSPDGDMVRACALVAVRVGDVRLIDNVRLDG